MINSYSGEELFNDLGLIENRLSQMQDLLKKLKQRLKLIKEKTVHDSAQIQMFFADALKMLLEPFCKVISEEKRHFPLQIAPSPAISINDSILLKEAPNVDFIKNTLINIGISKVTLLYRGSRDGFRSSDFHKKCDLKGPTLVLVKSNEFYFGGVNACDWESYEKSSFGKSTSSPGSFLFSLNKKTKHEICINNEKFAIVRDESSGPSFDLCISSSSSCNTNNESHSELGNSYEKTSEFSKYLAGSKKLQSG